MLVWLTCVCVHSVCAPQKPDLGQAQGGGEHVSEEQKEAADKGSMGEGERERGLQMKGSVGAAGLGAGCE